MPTEDLTLKQIKTELLKLKSDYLNLFRLYKNLQGDIGREDLSVSLQNDIYNNGLEDLCMDLSQKISSLQEQIGSLVNTLNFNINLYNDHVHGEISKTPDNQMSNI